MAFKTQVAVGNDADEATFIVDHGDATDVVLVHQIQGIAHRFVTFDGNGVVNHTVFSTFHDGHLACLLLDAHVFVDNADTSLAGNGNGHLRLRYRVHGSGYERNLQVDVA